MVHGAFAAFGSGDEWEAEGCVDRVIHRRAAVAVAGDHDHDQVPSQLLELVVRIPAGHGQVGEENAAALAGRRDELRDLLLARPVPRVYRHRALALVEAGPVQAPAALSRPRT